MSLKLFIDEDSQAQRLVKLLRNAGHDVETVNEAGLSGFDDAVILEHARQEERLLLTQNCKDFEALHKANSNHPGILAVYQEANLLKNMTFKSIVRAIRRSLPLSVIANIEAANIPLANQFISLNQWNY